MRQDRMDDHEDVLRLHATSSDVTGQRFLVIDIAAASAGVGCIGHGLPKPSPGRISRFTRR
jgi:hypothetical protein